MPEENPTVTRVKWIRIQVGPMMTSSKYCLGIKPTDIALIGMMDCLAPCDVYWPYYVVAATHIRSLFSMFQRQDDTTTISIGLSTRYRPTLLEQRISWRRQLIMDDNSRGQIRDHIMVRVLPRKKFPSHLPLRLFLLSRRK